jgi:hypothetical protein
MKDNIKTWLLEVADGVEKWPLMSRDAMDRARIIATPTAAAVFVIARQVPLDQRAAVARALPLLSTDDFAVAAQMIREAARRGEIVSGLTV